MEKYSVGYTAGVFDLFHIGHLNLLQNAKKLCDTLIVGVNSDELVMRYKNKHPLIPAAQRAEIVRALRVVDSAHVVDTLDKVEAYKQFGFDVVFIGDDWRGNQRWIETEKDLAAYGVKVCYLPYTKSISSTEIAGKIEQAEKVYENV